MQLIKKDVQSLIIPIALIAIASFTYNLGNSMVFLIPGLDLKISYLVTLVCFMPIGFILLPHLISIKTDLYSSESKVLFRWKSYVLISLIIFFINHYFLGSDEYFHQMIIATCEEFLFRFVIYKIMKRECSYIFSIIVGSLLFGMLLHLNHPILDNLFIRTPFGILFSILATKFGLEYAIGGHWIYNLYQSVI